MLWQQRARPDRHLADAGVPASATDTGIDVAIEVSAGPSAKHERCAGVERGVFLPLAEREFCADAPHALAQIAQCNSCSVIGRIPPSDL